MRRVTLTAAALLVAPLLASSGVFLSDIVGADPATLDDPGLPVDLPDLRPERPTRPVDLGRFSGGCDPGARN